MRRTLITLAWFVLALAVGGFLFAWSGLYNIAASQGHWPTTRWLLEFGLRNSVETHTLGLDVPPLDDPSLVHRGAGHYQGGCLPCHGAPGEPRNLIVRQMLPEPPYLVGQIPTWEPEELFWIVKHGIKYAGMPAWVAQQRDDEVWAMVAFLERLPALSAEEYRRLALGPLDPPPGPVAGEDARLLALGGVPWERLTACARCHGMQGEGGGAGGFPRLAGQSEAYLYGALQGVTARTVRSCTTQKNP